MSFCVAYFLRRITLSSVECLAVPYFSALSHKRRDFIKKLLNTKCVFLSSLQLLSEVFFYTEEFGEILL